MLFRSSNEVMFIEAYKMEGSNEKYKKISLIAMIIMGIISFSNLMGLKVAGVSVIIGAVFFFINKKIENQSDVESGFDMNSIKTNLQGKGIWTWVLLPLILDALSITISKVFLPEYISHVLARTESFVSFDKIVIMVLQLAFLALGEEIAWVLFFKNS